MINVLQHEQKLTLYIPKSTKPTLSFWSKTKLNFYTMQKHKWTTWIHLSGICKFDVLYLHIKYSSSNRTHTNVTHTRVRFEAQLKEAILQVQQKHLMFHNHLVVNTHVLDIIKFFKDLLAVIKHNIKPNERVVLYCPHSCT